MGVGVGFLLMLLVMAALRFRCGSCWSRCITVPLSLAVAVFCCSYSVRASTRSSSCGCSDGRHCGRRGGGVHRSSHRSHAAACGQWRCSIGDDRDARGVTDIRGPLTYAALIVLLAVVPIAVLAGRPGAFFAPMVLAYVLGVVAAMLVALLVTPALTVLVFNRWRPTGDRSTLFERARGNYATALHRFSRHPVPHCSLLVCFFSSPALFLLPSARR